MKKAVIKKACKWSTLDGSTVEMSSGYPLADTISLMRFSLTKEELTKLAGEFLALATKRDGLEFHFTPSEILALQKSPEAVSIAMDVHDCWICEGEAMGFNCKANEARKEVLRIERDRLVSEI